MTKVEVEDGEAYYFRGGDDDENIDPDRDFSYIDRRIASVLGQYQKDFMGGISAESLGARFGGYGSFLPMQQRSPPILSNQKSQTHVTLKSPQDLPSESSHQSSTISVNHVPPAKSIPATGDQSLEAVSESGISSMNSQIKPQCSGEFAQNHQTKKPIINNSGKNSLKFRFKMAPENISNLDKSAIYSGLGLDISPSSSPEDSPSENDETSAGLQEMNVESPSFIVKIMTSIPFSHNELLSPLQDSLVIMKDKMDYAGTGLPGIKEGLPVNIVQENMYLKGKKEERKDRKSKVVKDKSKVKRSKQKEASNEKELKKKAQSQKPLEMMKENCEYSANKFSLSTTTKEENGASIAREVVSNAFTSEVGAYSEEECASMMNKSFDIDIGKSLKQVSVARRKAKDELVSAKKHDGENGVTLQGKTEDRDSFFVPRSDTFTKNRDEGGWREDEVNKFPKQYGVSKHIVKEEVLESAHSKAKNVIFIPKSESSSDKRNEGRGKEGKEILKQQSTTKDHVKEEVVSSVCPVRPSVHEKENGFLKMNPKDEEMGLVSLKDEEKDKYNDVSLEMKYDNVETVELLKQKARPREITRSLAEQGLPGEKENLSSAVKKKPKDSQIGVSSVEPPRGSLIVCSSASKNEGVNSRLNMPPKIKGDTDQHREMRKSIEVAGKAIPRKKGKEGSSKDFGMGVLEQEAEALPTKLKDKSSGMKTSSASNVGSNIVGDLTGIMPEKASVDVPPAANAPPVTYLEDWVECEKCHKWRLLPLGMSAASLTEKKWTCNMLTWLPGMNKCSFSEDDTTNALRALYVPVDSASLVPNNEPVYQEGSASVNVRVGPLNVTFPSHASGFDTFPTGGKKKNLVSTDMDAVRQTAFQDFRTPVRKDKVRTEMRNSKILKKLPRESDSIRKSGDGRASKIEKKRLADVDAYGVSKKMKRVREQSIEAYDPGALRIPQNFAKGSPKYPLVKDKKRTQSDMMSKDDGTYSEPRKKRKIKDKQQRDYSVVAPSGKGGHLVNNWDDGKHSGTEHRNEKKSKSSNVQSKECSATKGNHRIQSDDAIANLGGGGDSSLHKIGRSEEQFHVDRVSRKAPGGRTSEMALDMGLSDNATTSSSSKVSCKVKAKVNEVKSSPAGSTSSSPLKVSKAESDKGMSKKSLSYNEQRLRFGAESAANDCAPPNELFRDRKSNLSRHSGIISDTSIDDHFAKKVSSGRHSSSHVIDSLPKFEDLKHTGGKLEPLFEGTSTLQRNLVTKSPQKLHLDGTNTEKGRSHVSKVDNEKEVSSNAHDGTECEGGSGTNGGRSDNVNGKSSGQVVVGHVILRTTSHHTGPATTPSDIEASSSRKKDNFHRAANTALREAKDLKHNANRLKVSGSGLESTGVSFQAALKFLHGASLLEPGNSESRGGEMTPNEVYTSTAKLCENCALEYERCNDMASAALAYKCMEVAYMRLVYCNDLAASRDRQELQMAVRVAPQVESPSSSASDIDNLNQVATDSVKDGHSAMDQRSHVVSAGNRPNFMRLLDFTHDINLAMEACRRSQSAFAAAMPVFAEAGNMKAISCIKRVLDFSFHDVDGILHLVRLAIEAIKCSL